jgi:signal transduction histidine kinase
MTMRMLASFRTRILAIIVAVGLMPSVVMGLWLSRATARSGEALLLVRLEQALDGATASAGAAWVTQRSALMDLADVAGVRAILAADAPADAGAVAHWASAAGRGVRHVSALNAAGAVRWSLPLDATDAGPAVPVRLDVFDGVSGPLIGRLEADIAPDALLGGASAKVPGIVLGAFDPASGTPLLALPFDAGLLKQPRFLLGSDEWVTARRLLTDPPLLLVAAAPLTPFIKPFAAASRKGALLVTIVAALGLGAALLLTGRLTRSLSRLAAAADAVARGEMDRVVDETGSNEHVRVARAFNAMTRSLRGTLAELADRRALAAVGEFAASLAHEIRNPLTAIQLDLQMVEERLPPDDRTGRDMQARALAEIRRLDRTVAGTLAAARAGRAAGRDVDLSAVIRAAAAGAEPAIHAAGASLEMPAMDLPLPVIAGDADALQQVFLNLLLNAADAVAPGGHVSIRVQRAHDAVVVTVADNGRGISADDIARVWEPLHTTRAGGAGLGLPIARRLTEAHGGDIALASTEGRGTVATVRLPLPKSRM